MSKKYAFFLFGSLFFSVIAWGQNYQLLFQPFEFIQTTDTVDGGVGTNSGVNRWRINNVYDGLSIYPNTVSQDSTYLGQINAPNGKYLHIYDSGNGQSQGIFNCSYDPAIPSDRFAVVDSHGVCTIGFDTVYFSFFYTCMGDTNNAYGQVYYSRNSGPWTLASPQHYSNKTKWKYELITNSAFNDATNLRFGFRWVNNGSAAPVSTAMGVDDVQIVGHFDSTLTTATTVSTFATADTVCAGTNIYLSALLSDTICDGTYIIEMSDANGDFSNPTSFGSVNINYPNTSWLYPTGYPFQIPNSTFPGNCYQFRFRRFLPVSGVAPIITIPTPCIVIIQCADSITTLQPVVTLDTNAVCAGSVIDVPFFSYGVYQLNQYIAQLSDINGSFANPTVLGSMNSDVTYDPNFPTPGFPPPGNVSGLIPDTVSPGCNYYVRVIATGPTVGPSPTQGTPWGPFCIQHCDMITNNEQDECICLTTDSICININCNINFYDSLAVYQLPNEFKIQIISRGPNPPPFTQVGTLGGLGTVTAINDTTVQLCVSAAALSAAGVPPGSYYMRLVATNPSGGPDSAFGSIVRLTIRVPQTTPINFLVYNYPSFTPYTGNKICEGQYLYFLALPPPGSGVEWVTSFGTFRQNPFLVWFNGPGSVTIRVREAIGTFGQPCYCLGPLGPQMTIQIQGHPNVNIGGPATKCVGDTIQYQTSFQNATFFLWDVTPGGTITSLSNNVAKFTFDTAGVYTLSLIATNDCFSDTGYKTVTIKPYPIADAGTDTTICAGSQVTLFNTPTDTSWTFRWLRNNIVLGTNDSLTVSPTSTTSYTIEVTNPPVCKRYDTITVAVEQPPESYFQDSLCIGGSLVLDPGVNPATYVWYDSSTVQQHTVTDSGTYTVNIQVDGETCYRIYSYTVGYSYPDSSEQNMYLCTGDMIVLDATEPGAGGYLWNTGETTPQISVDSVGTYSVVITSPLLRCEITKTFYAIEVPDSCDDRDFVLPNVFTPNGDGLNDDFHALTFGTYQAFGIKIFNRWGELVFESADQYFKWDGNNQDGKECTAGVYYYVGNIVHPKDTRALHGFVTLIRDK